MNRGYLAFALMLASSFAQAQVYKCNEGGRIVFSDYPCQRTDNKAIDVRPATGGPVNRSSEYYEQQRRVEEERFARERAEIDRDEAARLRLIDERVKRETKAWEQQRQRAERDAEASKQRAKHEADRRDAAVRALSPSRDMSCWRARFEKDEYGKMDALVARFMGAESIASSTPRIQLAAPLLQLQGYRDDLAKLKFSSPCLVNMSSNAMMYADMTLTFYKAFLGNSEVSRASVEDAARYLKNYQAGKVLFGLQ